MRAPSFGLGREFYVPKPVRQLRLFKLHCHTGTRGEAPHVLEAKDYTLEGAMAQARDAGYRLVSPL